MVFVIIPRDLEGRIAGIEWFELSRSWPLSPNNKRWYEYMKEHGPGDRVLEFGILEGKETRLYVKEKARRKFFQQDGDLFGFLQKNGGIGLFWNESISMWEFTTL